MSEPLLELLDIRKRFGAFEALRGVRMVTALLGENGAGKTTLMKIAAGLQAPDSGVLMAGKSRHPSWTVREASKAGVRMVEQHFSLAGQLTIAENLALHATTLPALFGRRSILRIAEAMVEMSGLPLLGLERRVDDVSVGEKAKIEVIKAAASHPRVLILDEPTSVLGPREIEEIEALCQRLKADGRSVVIITHKLPEVFRLADDVVVMRAGEVVYRDEIGNVTPSELAGLMSLAPEVAIGSRDWQKGEIICELSGVSTSDGLPLTGIDLVIAAGEIAGVVGAAGNGQSELAALLRGLVPFSGSVRFENRDMTPATLFASRLAGHIPSDRTGDGLFAGMSIQENLAIGDDQPLAGGRARASRVIEEFSIRARSPLQSVSTLSGGNQQKVLVARELARKPRLLVAAEPTRGLDLASASAIRRSLLDAARAGAAVLLISSDLEEVLALAGKVHVVYRGKASPALKPNQREEIVELVAGSK